jgi:hypothetical protein
MSDNKVGGTKDAKPAVAIPFWEELCALQAACKGNGFNLVAVTVSTSPGLVVTPVGLVQFATPLGEFCLDVNPGRER